MGKQKLVTLILLPVIALAVINLFTVFTPEIGFDALWYHLTLPKLWLLKHQWYFPGGLLYYSAMPRLSEIIFTPLIYFTGFVGPKFVQFLSGLGTCLVMWKIAGHFKLSTFLKSVSISIFYCTWLVSWQSGSAYIDLIRTFLETTALYFLLLGSWKKGGLFLGLAVGTKWLSLGSLSIYSLVFGIPLLFPAFFVSLPWLLAAFHFTGNPVYPLFSGINSNSFMSLSEIIKHLVLSPYYLTKPFDDFLSPLIGLVFIISIISLFSKDKQIRQLTIVGILGTLFSLSLNPPSTRYVLPYLPALIISAILSLRQFRSWIQKSFFVLVFLSSFAILVLRIIADYKYLPYLLGKEDLNTFLTSQAFRLSDTFIDTDGFVERNIPGDSKVLIDKLHNLYYFPINFDHTSWVKNFNDYDYLVTFGENPSNIQGKLIHTNQVGIQIFKLKP